MKLFIFAILPAIIAISILEGFTDKPSLSLAANTIQMEKEANFNININGKRPGLTYHWTSSDNSVVEVNSKNGKIKAINYGEALISCMITDRNGKKIELSCKIIVGVDERQTSNLIWEDHFNSETLDSSKWSYEYGYVRNFELQEYSDSINNVFIRDGHLVLRALKDGNGAWTSVKLLPLAAQDRTVTWISSDPSVASVYGGYVRLLKAGTSIISATTANGLTRTLKVISY